MYHIHVYIWPRCGYSGATRTNQSMPIARNFSCSFEVGLRAHSVSSLGACVLSGRVSSRGGLGSPFDAGNKPTARDPDPKSSGAALRCAGDCLLSAPKFLSSLSSMSLKRSAKGLYWSPSSAPAPSEEVPAPTAPSCPVERTSCVDAGGLSCSGERVHALDGVERAAFGR